MRQETSQMEIAILSNRTMRRSLLCSLVPLGQLHAPNARYCTQLENLGYAHGVVVRRAAISATRRIGVVR